MKPRCKPTHVERARAAILGLIEEVPQLHRERAALRALLAPVMGVAPADLEDWTDEELIAYADLALAKIGTFVL